MSRLLLALALAAPAPAADLSALDRTIKKEPAYAGEPGYALAVFGPDAGFRVWLVRDGDTLYVDRNGNGDLTDPGEAVKAGPAAGGKRWEIGAAGPHANLDLSADKLRVFGTIAAGHPKAKAVLVAAADAEVIRLSADVTVPGLTGGEPGGRVGVTAGIADDAGFLRFGASPATAPVIWLGGPLAIEEYGWRSSLRLGRGLELYTSVGTRGAGPGTFASVAHEGLMPKGLNPVAEVSYPPKDKGGSPVVERYELGKRCCGINLYAAVMPPTAAGPGTATVTLAFPAWEAGRVAPTTFPLEVRPAPKLASEPVSAKLVRTLPHPDRAASISGLRVSADGKRVFGAGYPSGVLQLWEAAGGAELATVATPPGYRGSFEYAALSADWAAAFVPVEGDKVVRGEKDGKKTARREYAGEVRVYDLGTGKLTTTIKTGDRGPLAAVPSPDGTKLVTRERPGHDLGGKWAPGDRVVYRDLATGRTLDLLPGHGQAAFNPAGDRFAVTTLPLQDQEPKSAKVVLFDAATGTAVRTLYDAATGSASSPSFSPDGQRVLATIDTGEKERNLTVRVWDAATGATVAELVPPHKDQTLIPRFTPDGSGVVANTFDRHTYVWDVATGKSSLTADVGDGAMTRAAAVSPDGKTLAVAAMPKPDPSLGREPDPLDMGQPWVDLYDLATGTKRERLVCPHGWLVGPAFSPDGGTLFAGANGGVLVFAVR